MAFVQKLIEVSFNLQSGSGTSLTLSGLRVSCTIVKPGGQAMGRLEAAIYGMTLSDMNKLTVLGTDIFSVGKNSVTVLAGDTGGAMTTVFQGTIQMAYMDAAAMPQVAFRVFANAGLYESVKPVAPTSGTNMDVASVMQGLAKTMGLAFENNGISVRIAKLYLPGTAREQALELAQMAGIEWIIDNNRLAIWKPGQTRAGDETAISPQTGLVGYPAFNSTGIIIVTLFKPTLQPGSKITVQSQIQPACGDWVVYNLSYELESMVPKGKWFNIIGASHVLVPETS